MRLLIKNIKKLVQVEDRALSPRRGSEMAVLNCLDNAFLLCENGIISDYGAMEELYGPNIKYNSLASLELSCDQVVDAQGKMVLPAWCDSHTHLVYAGSREVEFIDKIRGLSYQEISRRGGGILNSVKLLHDTSEDDLFDQTMVRVDEIIRFGTGAVEIKSGYGLSLEDELKMLRVIKRISEQSPLQVKATFLGAHAVPRRYIGDRDGYVNEIINEMIPIVSSEGLAEFIDVFCEDGFFSVEDSDRILNAGMKYGLIPTVHANQMSISGGVQVGVKYGAISVAHLEYTGKREFEALKDSDTIATLLPGSTFFLEMEYAPAREMLAEGLPLALATNYNPGSSPSGDIKFMMSLACLKMKMTPEEAINAATLNGAHAMNLGDELGSITRGKRANLIITKEIPTYDYLLYAFNSPLIDKTILNGKIYG